MQNIKITSHRYRILFQVLFYVAPAFTAAFWLSASMLPAGVFDSIQRGDQLITLTPLVQFLGFLVDMLPVSIVMYGLSLLIRLFKNYELGNIFTLENAKYYRNLGLTLFYWIVAHEISRSLMSFVVTFRNPPEKRSIVFMINEWDFTIALVGGLILIIAWVMSEGHRLQSEQAYIV